MELAHQDPPMESNEQTHIAKGKRTKRQRLQSPIPFAVSNSGDGEFADDSNLESSFSPTTSDEEDMANCLILLAQGKSINIDAGPFHRSLPETAPAPAGCYGYECKTCYRTFPSFQALGGHRASHKKPKAMDEKKQFLSSDDEETQFKNQLSLQLSHRPSFYGGAAKSKVHECAICGAEFTSGQALGGHMRRHRAMPTAASPALSLTPMAAAEDQRPAKRQRSVISLDLDLNLPAPPDHHHQAAPPPPQHNKIFSAGTLVDCHY